MAFKFDMGDWVEDIVDTYDVAQQKVINVMKASVWEGAKEVADNVASLAQQHGLAEGLRISHIETSSDGADALIWFEGYFDNRWGQNVPYPLVVNALESGRSSPSGVTGKHPFFRQALRKANESSKAKMVKKFEDMMKELIGGK